MKVIETALEGVVLFEPRVFGDDRGFFLETWNRERYREQGVCVDFVQDNVSFSKQGVLRGLHLQNPYGQAKLVYVLEGAVLDVAVDVRPASPTYRRWVGCELSADNRRQLYIPAGYAHGFCVTGESALFVYKCSEFYRPGSELTIRWDDPDLAIDWPVETPIVSEKDGTAPFLRDIDRARLPQLEGGAE